MSKFTVKQARDLVMIGSVVEFSGIDSRPNQFMRVVSVDGDSFKFAENCNTYELAVKEKTVQNMIYHIQSIPSWNVVEIHNSNPNAFEVPTETEYIQL